MYVIEIKYVYTHSFLLFLDSEKCNIQNIFNFTAAYFELSLLKCSFITCSVLLTSVIIAVSLERKGWSGSAMVLGKFPVPGRPTIWVIVGQEPTALAVGAGGDCLDIFTVIYPFSPLSPSLWQTAPGRLKYCLKGPSNP